MFSCTSRASVCNGTCHDCPKRKKSVRVDSDEKLQDQPLKLRDGAQLRLIP